jgi:hypothetical protein
MGEGGIYTGGTGSGGGDFGTSGSGTLIVGSYAGCSGSAGRITSGSLQPASTLRVSYPEAPTGAPQLGQVLAPTGRPAPHRSQVVV